jgi:hypothetical protein
MVTGKRRGEGALARTFGQLVAEFGCELQRIGGRSALALKLHLTSAETSARDGALAAGPFAVASENTTSYWTIL